MVHCVVAVIVALPSASQIALVALAGVALALALAVAIERARLRRALGREISRYERLLQAISEMGEGVMVVDRRQIVFTNEAYREMTGYSEEELRALPSPIALVREDQRGLLEDLAVRRASGRPWKRHFEATIVAKDGHFIDVEASVRPLAEETGPVVCVVRDITGRKAAERALRDSEHIYRLLAEHSSDVIVRCMGDGTVLYVSPSCRALGYEPGDLIGSSAFMLLHPDDYEGFFGAARPPTPDGAASRVEFRLRRKDGTYLWMEANATLTFDPDGGYLSEIVAAVRDISERKEAEGRIQEMTEELHRLAVVDELTGLGNRRGFLTLAEHQIKIAHRATTPLTLLFVDLDGLKHINDRLGHDVGDRALIEAAEILAETFREADVIGRIGGDEFCVLLSGSESGADAARVRLERAIEDRRRVVPRPYRLSLSVGAAAYDPKAPSSLEQLMETADRRMYEQKRTRSRRSRLLAVDDDRSARLLAQMALGDEFEVLTAATGEEAIRRAAEENPDVILLDLRLPDLDGAEVARRLRAAPGTSHTPIVVLTGAGDAPTEMESRQIGIDDYLTKPVDADELRLRLERALERARRV